jgi:DNA-binding response OmpR family regulator
MATTKILIVEDNETKRATYREMLNREGYTIIEANNGEEGVKKAGAELPDLIIADINMPKMNGLQMVEAIKKNDTTKYIPVICISVIYKDLSVKMKALCDAGAEECFYMPENTEELLIKVQVMVRIRKIYLELLEKNKQLKIFNDSAVNRELKMVELKNKIKKLEEELLRYKK